MRAKAAAKLQLPQCPSRTFHPNPNSSKVNNNNTSKVNNNDKVNNNNSNSKVNNNNNTNNNNTNNDNNCKPIIRGGGGTYWAEGVLLSGSSFSCSLPDRPTFDDVTAVERPEPILNDLAKHLHAQLIRSTEMKRTKSLFIMFVRDDGDNVGVTAWDWERPLSAYL